MKTLSRATATPKIRVSPPGPNTQKWVDFHMKHASLATYDRAFVWDRSAPAIGPFCHDPDGNLFIDFASHIAASPLGYNNPELVSLAKKVASIDPDRYAGTDFIGAIGTDPEDSEIPTPSHLHHKIKEITKHFNFESAFFSNSGAEAVENAIKLAFNHQKNNGYGICFDGAFHGRTLGALSLNRSKAVHRKFYPQIPKIISFPYGKAIKDPTPENLEYTLDSAYGVVDPEEVAFIIVEPIQGEGGYRIPSFAFMQQIQEISHKYNIPLIIDEIQSGLGRTGKWWALEHFDIKPDLICSAKALRIGATIGKRKFFPNEDARISSTWGEGNAMSSALGYTIIDIIQKENLLTHVSSVGKYFLDHLASLQNKYQFITESRGLGLMLAIELDTPSRRDTIVNAALKVGLLIVGCGQKAIRLLPPLDVTSREIDLAVELLDKALKEANTSTCSCDKFHRCISEQA